MRTVRPCSNCAAPVTLKMIRCTNCARFNPLGLLARVASTATIVAGGVSVTSTLAACYGAPCANANDSSCLGNPIPTCEEVSLQPMVDDVDKDGYCLKYDCNEMDPAINAAAKDPRGDGVDQNCDGVDGVK
jgi:hypothetical protein